MPLHAPTGYIAEYSFLIKYLIGVVSSICAHSAAQNDGIAPLRLIILLWKYLVIFSNTIDNVI